MIELSASSLTKGTHNLTQNLKQRIYHTPLVEVCDDFISTSTLSQTVGFRVKGYRFRAYPMGSDGKKPVFLFFGAKTNKQTLESQTPMTWIHLQEPP